MQNSSKNSIYDLAVIGNGIAAQGFFWNLQQKFAGIPESKSQNFNIAHLFSETLAPACTHRSSATISLNGIEEDVSPLGNDMRKAYFLFDELVKKFKPNGVEEVQRVVVSTNENDTKKLLRRYKKLDVISSAHLKGSYPGTTYSAYIISPKLFSVWMEENLHIKRTTYPYFVKNMERENNVYKLTTESDEVVLAKKVLFATGAYSKIFESFYTTEDSLVSMEIKNTIKAGSYFERQVDFGPKSFYLSIDGHQALYRKNQSEATFIIGSATTVGAYEAPDLVILSTIFNKIKPLLTLELGEMRDYKITTGLRHKGPKRMLISESFNGDKTLFRINGLYKNGYTMGFLTGKKMVDLIKLD